MREFSAIAFNASREAEQKLHLCKLSSSREQQMCCRNKQTEKIKQIEKQSCKTCGTCVRH
jgi:dihydroxyacid dehydratase/phosphogluconate dehydratase